MCRQVVLILRIEVADGDDPLAFGLEAVDRSRDILQRAEARAIEAAEPQAPGPGCARRSRATSIAHEQIARKRLSLAFAHELVPGTRARVAVELVDEIALGASTSAAVPGMRGTCGANRPMTRSAMMASRMKCRTLRVASSTRQTAPKKLEAYAAPPHV